MCISTVFYIYLIGFLFRLNAINHKYCPMCCHRLEVAVEALLWPVAWIFEGGDIPDFFSYPHQETVCICCLEEQSDEGITWNFID